MEAGMRLEDDIGLSGEVPPGVVGVGEDGDGRGRGRGSVGICGRLILRGVGGVICCCSGEGDEMRDFDLWSGGLRERGARLREGGGGQREKQDGGAAQQQRVSSFA